MSHMVILEVPGGYEVPPAHIKLNSDHAETLPSHPTNGHLRKKLAWAENKDMLTASRDAMKGKCFLM